MEAPPSAPVVVERCPTDGPIGWVIAIFGGISALAILVVYIAAAYLFQALLAPVQQQSPQMGFGSPMSLSQPQAGPTLAVFGVFVVLMALSILTLGSGIGIIRGKKKGFVLGIPVFALLMLQGGGLTVLSLAIAVYCVLRLLAVIGPRPI